MPTRVALVDLSGLLADVVTDALTSEPDLTVSVLPSGSSVASILEHHPDVVMVGATDPSHYPGAAELLSRQLGLRVFAISPDAKDAWIHWLGPCTAPFAEFSAEALRQAVRSAVERAHP